MSEYSPRAFFRNVPNALLKRYFTAKELLMKHDFSELSETKVDPIHEAWLSLEDLQRNETEKDFREIHKMACPSGIKAILDEAEWHDENLEEHFEKCKGFHEKAFSVFLEYKRLWQGASAFLRADILSPNQWVECKTINHAPAKVDEESVKNLEVALSTYYYKNDGRGKNCRVDVYRRGELDYFFAFPENYSETVIEWKKATLQREGRNPAFEIIFVYSQKKSKISLYMKGSRATKKDVRAIFADMILGLQIGDYIENENVYSISELSQENSVFQFSPEDGIESVIVKMLKFRINGTTHSITLQTSPEKNQNAIYELRNKVCQAYSPSALTLTNVGIVVTFIPSHGKNKPKTKTFYISWPNSCRGLKHDEEDQVIRKMLRDSNIEPSEF